MDDMKREVDVDDAPSSPPPTDADASPHEVDHQTSRPPSSDHSDTSTEDCAQDGEVQKDASEMSEDGGEEEQHQTRDQLPVLCKQEPVDNNSADEIQPRQPSVDDVQQTTAASWVGGAANNPISPPSANTASSGGTSNFLQKLESFVASLDDQVASVPADGWRQVTTLRSGASARAAPSTSVPYVPKLNNSVASMANAAAAWNLLAHYTSHATPAVQQPIDRPLDLSVKRRSPDSVAESASAAAMPALTATDRLYEAMHRREMSYLLSGGGAVSSPVTPSANSLACLERDFGENSTILTRLGRDGSGHPSQRAAGNCYPAGDRRVTPFLTQSQLQPTLRRSTESITDATSIQAPSSRQAAGSRKRTAAVSETAGQRKTSLLSMSGSHPKSARRQTTIQHPPPVGVVRCLQCEFVFQSLPELTIHMIQSGHYANIVGCASSDVDMDARSVDSLGGRATPASHPGFSPSLPVKGLTEPSRYDVEEDMKETRKIWRPDFGTVSPTRSLDDESVSSTGLTETESLSPPSSSTSPVSSTRLMEEGAMDHAGLVSQLLQIQPFLASGFFDARNPALLPLRGQVFANGGGRNLIGNLPPKDASRSTTRTLNEKTGSSDSAVDLRRRNQVKELSRESLYDDLATIGLPQTLHFAKLFEDIWGGQRKKNGVASKRSAAATKWKSPKDIAVPEKRQRSFSPADEPGVRKREAYLEKSSGPDSQRIEHSRADPNSSQPSLTNSLSSIHSKLYCGSSIERQSANHRSLSSGPSSSSSSSSPQQSYLDALAADRLRSSNPSTTSVVATSANYDGRGVASTPQQRQGDIESRDDQTPGLRKTLEETEYAARFGKYCRLARELAGKSD